MSKTTEKGFKPYTGKAWIVFVGSDGKSWWADRLIGFIECEESSQYMETINYWMAAYLEDGAVMRVGNQDNCQVVYDREPTIEDAKKVKDHHIIDNFAGSLVERQEVLA